MEREPRTAGYEPKPGILETDLEAIRLEALEAAPACDRAPRARGHAALGTVALPYARHGERLTLGDAGAGATVEPAAGGSRISVWGWAEGAPPALALHLAIAEALRAGGLLPLHASAAEGPGGATVFLGGSGKSTTLLAAARSGARPIAEDRCWLDPADLTVAGQDRAVRLRPEALARFPGAEPAGAPEGDGKVVVPFDSLGRGGRHPARVRRLALLARDPARRSAWEEARPRAATRALWEATGVPLGDAARAATGPAIAGLVRRLELRRLVLGSGPLPDLAA